jgi:hypothetical protein
MANTPTPSRNSFNSACVPAGIALILSFAAFSFPTHAAEIYRWTDENGKTQISDTVPPKYKSSAKRVDSKQFEVSPEQRRDAEARAAQTIRAADAATPASGAASAAAATTSPNASAQDAVPAGPMQAASASSDDCATLQSQYRESQECFAPYLNTNGTIKPNAYAVCKVVVDPTVKCGSPKAY